jgi:hypothetical protein
VVGTGIVGDRLAGRLVGGTVAGGVDTGFDAQAESVRVTGKARRKIIFMGSPGELSLWDLDEPNLIRGSA